MQGRQGETIVSPARQMSLSPTVVKGDGVDFQPRVTTFYSTPRTSADLSSTVREMSITVVTIDGHPIHNQGHLQAFLSAVSVPCPATPFTLWNGTYPLAALPYHVTTSFEIDADRLDHSNEAQYRCCRRGVSVWHSTPSQSHVGPS
jgi:hypothetical protein